jgi:flagellar hook-length control protein FliK
MISSASASASISSLEPVAEGSAAPATSVTAPASAKGAFDAILALQNLAATCNALSPEVLEDVVGGLTESQSDGDDRETEEGEEGELGALEFLAALLNTPTPFKPQIAGGEPRGESAPGADTVSPDAGRGKVPAAALPAEVIESMTGDGAAPDKLTILPASTLDGLTPSREGTVDPAAQISRGAELLSTPRPAATVERAGIATPVRDPRWAEEFGARISMMVRGGESQASLQLSPVDLGPMDVSVTVKDSQASIHFGAAQAETRALIEASIPRLREMLAAQGFHLMDASVSQGFSRQDQAGGDRASASQGNAEADGDVTVARVSAAGLLDLYA